MSLAPELLELLACPTSGDPLDMRESDDGASVSLHSASETAIYPIVNGVPWLLANPQNSLVDWGGKLNHFNQVLLDEIQTLERELKHAKGATKDRLTRLHTAKQGFLRRVCELMIPVVSAHGSSKAVYDALRDCAPTTQNLLSYEANLYRDWVWGEQENTLNFDLVRPYFDDIDCDKLLVLGAGAGRLALDIHRSAKPSVTVATDINPLLVMAAQTMLQGQSLTIQEFPLHPRNAEYVALEHTLAAIDRPDGFHFVFADGMKPSFAKAAFDTVLTPWFIDIQPFEFGRFLRQLSQYIPVGGRWVNFGSLVFNQKRDALCYSLDEVRELAKQQGFAIEDIQEHEIPYLKSPYNAGYRMEHVWTWTATKTTEAKPLADPQHLPIWALDDQQPIPRSQYMQQFSTIHGIYAQLTAEVDGKTSLLKIARKVAANYKMDDVEALQLVKNFFLDLHRQNT